MRQHDFFEHLALMLQELDLEDQLENLLRKHTIAAAYWPFIDPGERNFILQSSRSDERYWTRRLLGISRSWPIRHPLRLCKTCMEQDLAQQGRCYWHVEHQLPGVAVCLTHGQALHVAQRTLKRWARPSDALITAVELRAPADAALTHALVTLHCSRLEDVDVSSLRTACLERLKEIGVIQSVRRTRHEHVLTWFRSTQAALLCETAGLGLESLSNGKWIMSLLWRHHRNHPVNWVVLCKRLAIPS